MRKLKRFALKRKALFIRTAAILLPMVFVMLLFSQTAFASNTYVITDGTRVFTYTTTATDPRAVLDEAGLELDEDDTYTTQAGYGTSEITVRRSQTISIDYYGEEMVATSFGESVEELLTRLNISLGESDNISWSLSDQTFDGMNLRIERVVHQNQTYTATVPHDTSYYYDDTIPQGMEEVVVAGMDGEILCTAAVTYINGEEVSRNLLTQTVISAPVSEVIAIGTGLAAIPSSDAHMPVIGDGTITLPTGEVLTFTGYMTCDATAYCLTGTTATGTQARDGVVAVDPRYIPFGTRMFIISDDGQYVYGIACAEDAGDDNIVGNRIDLWIEGYEACIQFGNRDCTVYFLGTE